LDEALRLSADCGLVRKTRHAFGIDAIRPEFCAAPMGVGPVAPVAHASFAGRFTEGTID